MREEIIKAVIKTAKCNVSSGEEGTSCCALVNPEEVADAMIKAVFGDLADAISKNWKPKGKLKELSKIVKKEERKSLLDRAKKEEVKKETSDFIEKHKKAFKSLKNK